VNRAIPLLALASLALACPAVTETVKATPAPAPAPADPAPVVDGDTTVAWLNGMQILIKKVPNAELVAAHLYVRGGSRNWTKDDAGIENLAGHVATTGGTIGLDKVAFGEKLATLGSTLVGATGRDWSSVNTKSLKGGFDETFKLLADVFLRPALPAAELELARTQTLIGLKREEEQPEGRLGVLVNATLYKGHPYENRPRGSLESVSKLTLAQVQAHLAKLREGSRLLLVVVGDVEPGHVLELAKASFGSLPRGSYVEAPLPRLAFAKADLTTEERKLPTNYIQGFYTAPAPGEPGYAAARVANNHLWDQMFQEVRTKRNLSYAPNAGLQVSQAGALCVIGVSAVDPTTTYKVMLDVLRKLQTTPLTEAELSGTKSTYLTHFLMASETTDGQADLLATMQLLAGDWRRARTFMDEVKAVTVADVQAFARTHVGRLRTILLGDPAKLDPALATSL
jgi:zinc protease